MTKVDIFSGFLGAGKTTLIKKLIAETYEGEKLVLIENEFGDIGIDGEFMQDAGITVNNMNSGCICCSLVGDFEKSLAQVITDYAPDRILIEPSGVGKLSDVMQAVLGLQLPDLQLNAVVTVADASKCKMYSKNFGEFFNNQIENAKSIVLSRTDDMPEKKLMDTVALLRTLNPHASMITTPWNEITREQMLETLENRDSLAEDMKELMETLHHGHHHHHEDGEECCCGHEHHEHGHHHHHEDGEECCCGHEHHEHEHHHHHEDGEECCCGHEHHEHGHHHHHEDGEECGCGCGHHHGHHHADEVFQSWGIETPKIYTMEALMNCLNALDEGDYGKVLRAKGILPSENGDWLHFDYVPEEANIRTGPASVIGRLCVIGAELQEKELAELFDKA